MPVRKERLSSGIDQKGPSEGQLGENWGAEKSKGMNLPIRVNNSKFVELAGRRRKKSSGKLPTPEPEKEKKHQTRMRDKREEGGKGVKAQESDNIVFAIEPERR